MSLSPMAGSRIRARRLDLGLRQSDVAARLGISAAYLNLIEHNRRRIGGKLLTRVAEVLETAPEMLSAGAEGALLDGLRAAAAADPAARAELDRIERFAGTYPGWAGLVAGQARRIAALERVVEALSDRLTHDPLLSESVHEVLSSVTAIRSTSAILRDEPGLDPEWRARFHRNLHEDSQRLTESAQALVGLLDSAGGAESGAASPQEEVEAWLSARDWHLPEVEQEGADPGKIVAAAPELATAAARDLAHAHLRRAIEDARRMPLGAFRGAVADDDPDPAAIAAQFGADMIAVFRRWAFLPDGDRPPGLVVCDGSGTITLRRPVEGFAVPRFGAACPLWPLYQALMRPMRPLRGDIQQAGRLPRRFTAFAVAQPHHPGGFSGPEVVEAAMLLLPAPPGADEPATVGAGCRICPRSVCPARREPSILSGAQ